MPRFYRDIWSVEYRWVEAGHGGQWEPVAFPLADVDEQELLPRGTPQQVARAVRGLIDVMAPGGGFFLGPTHNFQADIPTENILAMYEAGC